MRTRYLTSLAGIAAVTLFMACSGDEISAPPQPELAETPDIAASQQQSQEDSLIPGQYIVVFNDDVDRPVQLAQQIAAANGLTLRHTYEYAIKGFAAVVPDGALEALQNHPRVDYVEQDAYSYIDTHPRFTELMSERNRTLVAALAASAAAGPLKPPSNLSATAVSSSQINLSWDSGRGADGYEIERGPSAVGPFTKIDETSFTFYSDANLDAGTTYCYRARSFSVHKKKGRQTSGYSNTDCATTDGGTPTPPDAPSGLTANAVAYNQVDLEWLDNSDNEDSFEIERCTGTSLECGDTDFGFLASVGANTTSYSDNSVAATTTYTYRVFARNTDGDSPPSNEAEATTPEEPAPTAPNPPSGLNANAVAYNQVDLDWTDNSDNEDSFEIERCTGTSLECSDTQPFGFLASVGANTTTYSDNTVAAEMTYTYRVFARNTVGDSDYSNEAEATTPAEPTPGSCPDNGGHDPQNDPGDYGITATQATYNDTWKGVLGNDPATCGIKAWFFGIDTGVDGDHTDLNVVETVDFTGTNGTGEDDHGHGTHTAGTVAAKDGNGGVVGMAPGADIYGFKVCTSGGSCPNSDIIAGVDEVTARKSANPSQPMVANMSLGGGASDAIDSAVRESINAGVTYSLSAGNGVFGICFFPGDAQNASPARVGDDDINASNGSNGDTKRVNGALTTTSHNSSFNDVNCNYGQPVTFAAPGSGIRSTWVGGGYNTISGTSMAAPHAAGAAMLFLQDGTDDPTTVEDAMCQRTLPWTTNDLPNAEGRLNVDGLGTDPADAPNQPTATSTCS